MTSVIEGQLEVGDESKRALASEEVLQDKCQRKQRDLEDSLRFMQRAGVINKAECVSLPHSIVFLVDYVTQMFCTL